jgi:hypothetical protein
MPHLVDAYMSMISNQNTIYNQMTQGVKTFCHDVQAQYKEIILQSQIFGANVKGGMTVIVAKSSQDYENLIDAFNTSITSYNSV